uniref:Uncharacterized protein n=1 Tax=Peronospora matthiolae TaxID=2874970 RepID=A0AAV1UEV5_9STRA
MRHCARYVSSWQRRVDAEGKGGREEAEREGVVDGGTRARVMVSAIQTGKARPACSDEADTSGAFLVSKV